MHILGRSNPKKDKPDYSRVRAAYIKTFYPVSRTGMGRPAPTRLPRLNGTKGGYGETTR